MTDYLEGALDAELTAVVDEHFHGCPPCRAYRDEFLVTLKLLSSLPAERPSPVLEANLLAGYRR